MRSKSSFLNLWVAAFSVNFFFQLYRGSTQDIAIFTIALVLLILESSNYLNWIPEFKTLRNSRLNFVLLTFVSLYLLFTKRGAFATIWVFIGLFVFLFWDLWRRDNGEKIELNKKQRRSSEVWAILGIALCFWELITFVLASISKDDNSYPTISVLISPHLDGLIGRAIFIICWAALGFILINDWKEPK